MISTDFLILCFVSLIAIYFSILNFCCIHHFRDNEIGKQIVEQDIKTCFTHIQLNQDKIFELSKKIKNLEKTIKQKKNGKTNI